MMLFNQGVTLAAGSTTVYSASYNSLSNGNVSYVPDNNYGTFYSPVGIIGAIETPYYFTTPSAAYLVSMQDSGSPNPPPIQPPENVTVLRSVQPVGGGNVSSNVFVTPGQPATVGFVVTGTARLVLLRVVGPGLQSFGVTQPLTLPSVTLYDNSQPVNFASAAVNIAGPWRPDGIVSVQGSNVTGYQYIFNLVGTFPLTPGAGDWANLVLLSPGVYTLVASAPGGTQGQALCEVYFLPYAE